MTKFLKIYLTVAITIIILLPVFPIHAQGLIDKTFKCADSSLSAEQQTCTVNDFIRIAVNVSKIILGLTGSLALLAFVYGGFVFLLSGGSAQNVEKGKGILKAAVIGLVIVFASYSIIQFVLRQADLVDDSGAFKNEEFNDSGNWSKPPNEDASLRTYGND
jgi:hypothetical protein